MQRYRIDRPPVPVALATRQAPDGSAWPETVHNGLISVVTGEGREIAALGATASAFPLRSTAKPFQLLPYLLDELHAAPPPAEPADLAVMLASHQGEPMHTQRIGAILARWGLDASALQCGVHPPLHAETYEAMLRAGAASSAVHCNCSGKHTAMLALCKHRGWPLASYLGAVHPLQRRIASLLGALAGQGERRLPHVVDGCSLPSIVLPLVDLARLYARLAWPQGAPELEGRPVASELGQLFAAGVRHPELVAGTGALDTRLMQALPGRLFAKIGAAGLHALALAPDADYPSGLGIAIKVLDGDPGADVRGVVAFELLRQLGRSPAAARPAPAERRIASFRGRAVGTLEAVFRLERSGVRG